MAVPTPQGRPDGTGPAPVVPPELAGPLRTRLEAVADEVEEEVRRQVPEYGRLGDDAYGRHLRSGVVQALTLFVDHIADPRGRGEAIAATYHELGRGEALEGRSLDALQSALRVGGLHAWRLLGRTAEDLGLDSAVVSALGELAFQTVHEVAEAAAAGYAEARLRDSDELERRRRRLLDLLLGDGPVSPEAVQDLAHTEAARSLRWATRALGLMGRGILPRQGVVRCADHLSVLVLHSDEPLLAQLEARALAPLDAASEGQRPRLAETLLAWLLSGSNVPDVAARLHVHPQTVRYRLRQLEKLFGDALHDPGTRLDLILSLRAAALREQGGITP